MQIYYYSRLYHSSQNLSYFFIALTCVSLPSTSSSPPFTVTLGLNAVYRVGQIKLGQLTFLLVTGKGT